MSDYVNTMLAEASGAARRIDERAELLAASRDFRVVGSPWRFLFGAGERTLFLARAGDELLAPHVAESRAIGLRPIALPLPLGVEEASKRLDDFPPPFAEVTLSFPLAPGVVQPCYTFVRDDGRARVVGAADGMLYGEAMPAIGRDW